MTQTMLDERYGRTRSRRRRLIGWGIVALLVIAGGVWLVWITLGNSANSIDSADTGFTIDGPHSTTLSFQLTAPPGTGITCVLEADDEQHGIVGWRIVSYPPSDAHTQAFTETIPTVALATTGLVNACWVA
ncbi:DUF4307 domain-containing protein [Microbacterium sp. X-17]|uniref:DUF4307 domain-containing protein n=1 Tax=Microbacterium sp. X-17 TaxID=3144404 RepID=UPI0031F480C3